MVAVMEEQEGMTPEQAYALLDKWHREATELKQLKTREVLDRKDVAKYYFPAPKEGTNRFDIGYGMDLLMDHKFNRSVDEAALDANVKELRKAKVAVDELFEYKPVLKVKEYRKLTPEQREIVDACLTIKPSDTPSLKIVPAGSKDPDAEDDEPAVQPAPAKAARKSRAKPVPEPEPPAPTRGRRKR